MNVARGHIRSRPPGPHGEERWQIILDIGRDETGRRRQTYETITGTREDAEVALARLIVQRGDGKLSATDTTLAELAARWLDWYGPNLSPATVNGHRGVVRRLADSDLGRLPIRTVRTVDLDLAYAAMRERGLSPATIRQTHAVIRQSLRQAVRWDLVPTNVALDATLPRAPRREISAPSVDVVRRLIDGATELGDPDLAVLVRFAATTGARRGELAGLRWRDVDLTSGAVQIRSNVVVHSDKSLRVKAPKSHQSRRITVDPDTLECLRQHRDRCDDRAAACDRTIGPDTFVFSPAPDGSETPHPDRITKAFVRLCAKLGIEGVRLHDLRHFAASQMVAAGVPITTVAGRLGHRDAHTTLSVYSHFEPETDAAAAQVLGDLLS